MLHRRIKQIHTHQIFSLDVLNFCTCTKSEVEIMPGPYNSNIPLKLKITNLRLVNLVVSSQKLPSTIVKHLYNCQALHKD